MKTKILQQLKTKYNHFGVSDNVMDGVATQLASFVKEETEIEPAVNGAEYLLKTFQSYADSRVTAFKTDAEKNKTEVEALKAKIAELEGKEPDNPMEKMIETFNKQIDALNQSINKLSNDRTHEALTQKLKELIGSDVPESFYTTAVFGRQFTSEEQVNEFATQIKTGYEAHKQELANFGFQQTKQPEQGGGNPERNEVAEMINKKNEEIRKQKQNQ